VFNCRSSLFLLAVTQLFEFDPKAAKQNLQQTQPRHFYRRSIMKICSLACVVAGVTLSLGLSLGLGGCLITSHDHTDYSGRRVDFSTFSQIEPGKTTKPWVEAALGQPSSTTKLDDGSELMKWEYTERRTSGGSVFLIFSGDSTNETRHAAYVQVRDGVVSKAWREQ